MEPLLLNAAGREGANAEDLLHLCVACHQPLLGHEPADTLVAGRAGQAALVGPVLLEVVHLGEGAIERHLHGELLVGLVVVEQGRRELVEESGVLATVVHQGVQKEAQDGLFVALGIDVDEVKLSLAAVPVNLVVGRRVNVPAGHVEGLVANEHGGKGGVIVLGVVEVEGGSVTPVEVLTGPCTPVAGEAGGAGMIGGIRAPEGNRRLLCPGLAELVVFGMNVREKPVLCE